MCASRVGGKGQLLAGAGRCVKGDTTTRLLYECHVPRVLITSGCDTVGRVALLAHFGGIRCFNTINLFPLLRRITNMR